MKHLPGVILGLVCLALVVSLFVSKQKNDAQHQQDAGAIISASNLLSSCQTEVAGFKERALTLSNSLETCQSTSLTLSNQLIEAKSAFATAKERLDRQITEFNRQVTDLNRQTAQWETEKQASSERIADLTRQLAELTNQIASARASLFEANKDYALLDNRFRRDVAERVIVERKLNNRAELKAQLEYLLWNPSKEISEDRIREGLNVVVGKSNLCYVIAPE
jgi:chromosome segregation ATPase